MSFTGSRTGSSLVEGVRLRDANSWQELVRLYGPIVFGWCRQAGLQEVDATDVLQDVFRAVAIGIGSFQREHNQRGAFTAWMWRVTQSKILNHHNRVSRQPAAIGGSDIRHRFNAEPDPFPDETQTRSGCSDSSLVMRAAELVRPEFKETTWQAFWRVAIQEQPTDEVAAALNMSTAAVRQANYRVRRRLRAELEGFLND